MSEHFYGHHSTYHPPPYSPPQYYGLQPTQEQSVRRAIVLELLTKGVSATRIEQTAEPLVNYVMNGKKPNPNLIKKTEVKLPGDKPVEANAYLFDDNTIQIELKDPEMLATLFESLEIYGVSFYGIPVVPVDTLKDN